MKVIDVDRNKQEMTLSGLVRPQDVDSRDVVESSSIADARLVYISKGLDRPRSGILGRIVGIIWP
jgi:flagellar L-ring protein precursor FlgH